jgi:NAD(P)-dependent dehydrogenase (short-subunit alcohol dehydrogenase family)
MFMNQERSTLRGDSRVAVVSGGTGALGSVVVAHLLGLGYRVAVPSTNKDSLDRLGRGVGADETVFMGAVADLTRATEVEAFISSVISRFGRVDCLINLAGGYAGGAFVEEFPLDEIDRMLNINFRSALLMCRAVLPGMKARGSGRIVNVASLPAVTPKPRTGPYAIAKRAVITLTETIAEEGKGSGVTANAIAPGIIVTDANREAMPGSDVSRWVTPEEIAHLIAFLCSAHGGLLNGNVLKAFGGL